MQEILKNSWKLSQCLKISIKLSHRMEQMKYSKYGVELQLSDFKVILGNQKVIRTQKLSMYTENSEVSLTLVQWMMMQLVMFLDIVESGQLVNSSPPRIINCSYSEKKGGV